MENISHGPQSKIPAAIQQLGDEPLSFAQTIGQFFPGKLFFFKEPAKNFGHFQNKLFLSEQSPKFWIMHIIIYD